MIELSSKPNIGTMEDERDVNGLVKTLKSEDVFIRRNATKAIGRLGRKYHRENINNNTIRKALNEALGDEDHLVKKHAKNALEQLESDNYSKFEDISGKESGYIIVAVIAFIIILAGIWSVASAPTVTALSITSPVSLTNNEVGEYYYEEYNITNTTKSIEVQGQSTAGAEVTAYVVYENQYYEYDSGNISDDFKNHSTSTKPLISEAKKVGKKIQVPIDSTTGQFKFTVATNPDGAGDTWIYIIATSPKHEDNTLELILTYPSNGFIGPTSTETSTTSNTSTPPSEDYDRGYDSGYYDGVIESYSNEQYDDNLAKTLSVSDIYRYGYREGYKQGYSDIENGRSLQKPHLSFNSYYDPRTGETIDG